MTPQNILKANAYLENVRTALRQYPDWRIGQAAMNLLMLRHPQLWELVHATDFDPFYASDVEDPRYQRLMTLLFMVDWP